jgi:hypothetical protein
MITMATRERISQVRTSFEEEKYESFPVQIGNFTLRSFVIPAILEEKLPNFAMQMVADDLNPSELIEHPGDVTLFGVSDAIPAEFRAIVARHEMLEYVNKVTCIEAAALEIQHLLSLPLSKDQILQYLDLRTALFEPLVPYVIEAGKIAREQSRQPPYSERKILEFKLSRDFYAIKREIISESPALS